MPPLPPELLARLADLCARGEAHAAEGDLDFALRDYRAALALLPGPALAHEPAAHLLTSVGEALLLKGEPAAALESLEQAGQAPGGADDPYRLLRLAQARLALGEHTRARDALRRAVELAGRRLLEGEPAELAALLG